MKGKDIEAGAEVKSQEDIAKEVIIAIKEHIKDKEEELVKCNEKLAEVLEKDIQDIKAKDGNWYDWD